MRGTIADRNVALHLAIRILPVSDGSDTEASRQSPHPTYARHGQTEMARFQLTAAMAYSRRQDRVLPPTRRYC